MHDSRGSCLNCGGVVDLVCECGRTITAAEYDRGGCAECLLRSAHNEALARVYDIFSRRDGVRVIDGKPMYSSAFLGGAS